jgi:hypothetical protein
MPSTIGGIFYYKKKSRSIIPEVPTTVVQSKSALTKAKSDEKVSFYLSKSILRYVLQPMKGSVSIVFVEPSIKQ